MIINLDMDNAFDIIRNNFLLDVLTIFLFDDSFLN